MSPIFTNARVYLRAKLRRLMQNILENLSEGVEIKRKAMLFTGLVLAYVGFYAFLGSSSDSDTSAIMDFGVMELLLMQGILSGVFFILLPSLFIIYTLKYPFSALLKPFNLTQLFYVFVIALSSMMVLSVVVEWNVSIQLPESAFRQWAAAKEAELKILTEYIINFQSFSQFLVALLVVGVFAAVGEEILFRGLLQNLLSKVTNNAHVGVWVAAIIFSAIHLQFYGFLPRVLLGALFGYLYLWSGKLSIAILAHFLHNGLSLVIAYVASQQVGGLKITPEQMDQSAPWPIILAFLVLGVFAIRKFINISNTDGALAEGI
jgi:membrane protease YdiL (CAAX protease family)